MRPLNVGIVGCGRITDMHAPGYLRCEDARIHTVCDLASGVAERRKQEWGAVRATTSFEDVLADPEIDLVEIITPHHLHKDMAVAACEAGKHVSLQKPMAMNVAECDTIIAAAEAAGVNLKVFENFVFHPPYIKCKELIADGAIGEPLSIRLRIGSAGKGGWPIPLRSWLWRLDASRCGGGPTIFDDGYHKFSVAIELMGPVATTHAWIDRTFGLIDAPALISWRHEGGRVGCIEATMSPHMSVASDYYPIDERVEITGSEGSLLVTSCTARFLPGPPLILRRGSETTTFDDLRDDWLDSFMDSTQHFVRVIREGGEPHLTGQRGKAVLQFVLAALRSAELGRPVRPDEVA